MPIAEAIHATSSAHQVGFRPETSKAPTAKGTETAAPGAESAGDGNKPFLFQPNSPRSLFGNQRQASVFGACTSTCRHFRRQLPFARRPVRESCHARPDKPLAAYANADL